MAPRKQRWIGWTVAGLAAVALILGLLAQGRERRPSPRRDAPQVREVGPSGGIFRPGRGRRAPTAADVLGALRNVPHGEVVTIEGRVLDAISRQPVGGVEVVFASLAGEATTTADADGAYSIDVPSGEYRAYVRGDYVISVGAAPYERLPGPPDPTAASAPDDALATVVAVTAPQRGVDLEVQRSGVITGHVVDGTGRPVAGAVVRAQLGPWRPVLGTDIAESGPDGSFRLEVPAGYYDLDAAHPDFAGPALADGMRPNVMVYPQMDTEVELALARGCIIEGRAIRRDGSPAGAGALERRGRDEFYPAGPMSADGTFRYTTVFPGDVTIRAWPWKSPPSEAQSVWCEEGTRRIVEFVVPDVAPELTGRIVDASGTPQAGAYIDIYGPMNQQERADDDGNWAVYALPPGDYVITAHVPGKGVASTRTQVPGSGVELVLSGTGALAGTVDGVDDGETFQLTIQGCSADAGSVVMPQTTRVVPVIGGRYRVDGLPACDLLVSARSSARTLMTQATIVAGTVATTHFDLAPPRAKTVRVSVIDAEGDAVPNAQIVVSHLDGAQGGAAVMTDSAGVASVEAHVGDILHAFWYDPAGSMYGGSGDYEVSNAPGSTEDAEIRLAQVPTWSP